MALCLGLSACGANMRSAIGTAQQAWDGGAANLPPAEHLDPRLDYLRVEVGRRTGLMVRAGSTGPSTPTVGRVTHWYSADGALLRLLDGRLVGLTEASRYWRVTQGPETIDWLTIAAGRALDFERTVDQQPGYRVGLRQARRLEVSATPPPGHRLHPTPAPVAWFFESSPRAPAAAPSWYAVDLAAVPPRVVYGHTCLAPDWCVTWQPWPPLAARTP